MKPVKQAEFERVYDASIETVWEAWTNPEKLKQWWGPDNVVIPECEVDLRVDGRFYIVMEATEAMGEYAGTRWPMDGKYTVVEENSRLAYASKAWTEGDKEATLIDQTTDLEFLEEDGKTKIKLKVIINSTGPNAGGAVEGMKYGFNQQFDKLVKFLQK